MTRWWAYGPAYAPRGRGFIQRFIFIVLPLPLLLFIQDPRLWGLVGGLAVFGLGRAIKNKGASSKHLDLLFLLLAALVAYALGFRIEFLTNPQGGFFYLTWLSLPLTLLWIVIVSGAFNFLSDEKLLARVSFLICLAFLLISLLQEPSVPFATWLTVTTLGMLMVLRFSSAKLFIFSRELGFVIALISIAGVLKAPVSLALLTPVLILGVPVMTASFPIAYGRALENPVIALFAKRGYSQRTAVFLIYLVMSYLSVSLVLLSKFTNIYTFALMLGMAMASTALFWGGERVLRGAFKAEAQRVHLFGIPIDRLDLARTVDKLEGFIKERRGHVICTPDTTALMRAQWDEKLRAIYQRADLVTADGMGLIWATRCLGMPLSERVAGIDVVYELCRRANKKGYRLFLLGAKPGVAKEAAARLTQEFWGLKVVGTHHGYFNEAEHERIICEIKKKKPDVLLVGMGVPKQELFMMGHKTKLNVPVIMGVGGSFDVLSGRISRAPKVWQGAGLEWAYRILIEPRRLWRARLILIFILKVLLLKFMVSFEGQPIMPSVSKAASAGLSG